MLPLVKSPRPGNLCGGYVETVAWNPGTCLGVTLCIQHMADRKAAVSPSPPTTAQQGLHKRFDSEGRQSGESSRNFYVLSFESGTYRATASDVSESSPLKPEQYIPPTSHYTRRTDTELAAQHTNYTHFDVRYIRITLPHTHPQRWR